MILIKDGRLIDPLNKIDEIRDIIIEGDSIKNIGKFHNSPDYSKIIDAKGCIVAPGLIGTNLHLEEFDSSKENEIEDNFNSAVAGGYTALIYQTSVPFDKAVEVEIVKERFKKLGIKIFITASLPGKTKAVEDNKLGGSHLDSVVGVCNDSDLLGEHLEFYNTLQKKKIPVCINNEYAAPDSGMNLQFANISHDTSVSKNCMFALHSKASVLINDIRTKASTEMVKLMRGMGAKVYAEVIPSNFSSANEFSETPFGSKENKYALIEGLRDGTISIISAFNQLLFSETKEKASFEEQTGMVRNITSLSLGLTYLVIKGHLTMRKLIEKMTINPSKIFNLDMGYLSEGSLADIVIFDENELKQDRSGKFAALTLPSEEDKLYGNIRYTICSGKILYENTQH